MRSRKSGSHSGRSRCERPALQSRPSIASTSRSGCPASATARQPEGTDAAQAGREEARADRPQVVSRPLRGSAPPGLEGCPHPLSVQRHGRQVRINEGEGRDDPRQSRQFLFAQRRQVQDPVPDAEQLPPKFPKGSGASASANGSRPKARRARELVASTAGIVHIVLATPGRTLAEPCSPLMLSHTAERSRHAPALRARQMSLLTKCLWN
jgi:hypothetical protein